MYPSIHDIQVSMYPSIRIHNEFRYPTIHVSKHWIVGQYQYPCIQTQVSGYLDTWSLASRLDRINRKDLDETIFANPAIEKRGPAQDLNDINFHQGGQCCGDSQQSINTLKAYINE